MTTKHCSLSFKVKKGIGFLLCFKIHRCEKYKIISITNDIGMVVNKEQNVLLCFFMVKQLMLFHKTRMHFGILEKREIWIKKEEFLKCKWSFGFTTSTLFTFLAEEDNCISLFVRITD